MVQTLEDLENEFDRRPDREAHVLGARGSQGDVAGDPDHFVFLKAVVNGKIIGAVRGFVVEDTAYLSRVIVHPYFRNRGIGRRLTEEIEKAFAKTARFEIFTGHRSESNLRQFKKLGYSEFKTEPFTPAITWVYLEKRRS
ncbi:MAG: GNAT family N-acetyltransferase [Verrucomicrobiota bacterium]